MIHVLCFMNVGLESLIPNKNSDQNQGNKTEPFRRESVFWIEVAKIKPNPYQPRKIMDSESLRELSESIRQYGVLQPLLVTKVENEVPTGTEIVYYLIAGERRLEAAKLARLPQVPVIIREASPQEKLELALVENVQREDLNALEKAEAFQRMAHEFHLTHKDIADKVGKSRVAISNLLRLLELPQEIKESLRMGKISEGHARAILQASKPEIQLALHKNIIDYGLSVRETEERARAAAFNIGNNSARTKTLAVDTEIMRITERIKKMIDFEKVRVQKIKEGIQMVLKFDSLKELEQLMRNLKR